MAAESTTETKPKNNARSTDKAAQTLLVGVDDGYAQTKIFGDGPDGKTRHCIIRSSARPGRHGLSGLNGESTVAAYDVVQADGTTESFTVSDQLEAEDTKFDGFHVSNLNRALVQHALIQAGYTGQSVKIFTGVPVSDYFLGGTRDDEKLQQKQQNLRGEVRPLDETEPAFIRDVHVGCQGVAAFIDFATDAQGQFRQDIEMDADTAVVDIGGRTTDIAMIVNSSQVDHKRSGTRNTGVLNVYDDVADRLRQEFRAIRDDVFPMHLLDQAVRNQSIRIANKEHDISEIVTETLGQYESQLAREVDRRIGGAGKVAHVVFVGGGANLFRTIAEKFDNGVVTPEPEMANARGLYKLLKLKG